MSCPLNDNLYKFMDYISIIISFLEEIPSR